MTARASRDHGSGGRALRAGAGYSLVELLVVCAMVAIIAALSLPSYSAARRLIYNSVALRDLVQARTALQAQVANPKNGTTTVVGPAAFPGATNLRVSRNVRLRITMSSPTTAGDPRFTITSTHTLGSATYTVTETNKITTNVGKMP